MHCVFKRVTNKELQRKKFRDLRSKNNCSQKQFIVQYKVIAKYINEDKQKLFVCKIFVKMLLFCSRKIKPNEVFLAFQDKLVQINLAKFIEKKFYCSCGSAYAFYILRLCHENFCWNRYVYIM